MNVTRATLFQLFGRNIRHVVPLFQRQYVWSLERQWQPLWKDISTKADEYMDYRHNQGAEPTQHFLGAVVLNSLRFHGFQIPAELVIDGQQRLTTLQIVMRALSDYAASVGCTSLVQNFEMQLSNRGAMEQDYEAYKVWPTNADQKVYQDVFQAHSPANLKSAYPQVHMPRRKNPEPRPRLVEAYLNFYQWISDYAAATELPPGSPAEATRQAELERVDALGQTLLYYMELVKIDLDEKDNPQVIFETLNYRGEPLTPSDLIRNFVFLAVRNQQKKDTELYNAYWLPYDQPGANGAPNFWKLMEKSGRFNYQRLDLFVYHYLILQTKETVSVGRLYQDFTKWWNSTRPDVEVELQRFQQYSRAYKKLLQPDSTTHLGRFAINLRILDYTTLYPLILFLIETCKDEIPPAELDGILTDLESYLVRRAVCNLTAKNYNNLFLSWLNTLKETRPVTRASVRELLLQSDVDTARWPADDVFEHYWMHNPVYQILRNRTRVVLEALDRYQYNTLNEVVSVDYSKTTIEHVMPQAWEPHYPLPAGSGEMAGQARSNLIHTIGNLTLLTAGLNTTVSNGPFRHKRPQITVQSLLKMNAYFQTFGDDWTEHDIFNRGVTLFEMARKIWPHPAQR